MDPEVGDIYEVPGLKQRFKVIGVNQEAPVRAQYWIQNMHSGAAGTYSSEFLEGKRKVEPFFEEDKSYKSDENGRIVTIWHVHQMAHERVAVAQVQSADGDPVFLREGHFKHFTEI